MEDCKAVTTPMVSREVVSNRDAVPLDFELTTQYRSLVWGL